MTMMKARVTITWGAMGNLAKANTIVFRYLLFRKQGFVDSKKGLEGGEKSIIDHRIIQSRVFPIVGTQMALFYGSRHLLALLKAFDESVKKAGKDIDSIDTSMLPELHATSAGMKAFGTEMALAGIEEGRKCCGGQGFTLSSGLARHVVDYTPNVTYEGDRLPMALQTARVLLGALQGKVPRKGTMKYLSRSGSVALSDCDDTQHLVKVWESIARNAVNYVGRQVYFSGKAKGKPFDVTWNNNHARLVTMAQAHTLFNLIESFSDGLQETPAKVRPVMERLCRLFALTKLIELPVVVTGITHKQGLAIDRAVKKLLAELRPDIIGVTEAPDMCERMLNSYIAKDSDQIYEGLVEWSRRSPLNRPEYIQSIHAVASATLNKEYLSKGREAQSALYTPSKL
jgi:hypothetical protein